MLSFEVLMKISLGTIFHDNSGVTITNEIVNVSHDIFVTASPQGIHLIFPFSSFYLVYLLSFHDEDLAIAASLYNEGFTKGSLSYASFRVIGF